MSPVLLLAFQLCNEMKSSRNFEQLLPIIIMFYLLPIYTINFAFWVKIWSYWINPKMNLTFLGNSFETSFGIFKLTKMRRRGLEPAAAVAESCRCCSSSTSWPLTTTMLTEAGQVLHNDVAPQSEKWFREQALPRALLFEESPWLRGYACRAVKCRWCSPVTWGPNLNRK